MVICETAYVAKLVPLTYLSLHRHQSWIFLYASDWLIWICGPSYITTCRLGMRLTAHQSTLCIYLCSARVDRAERQGWRGKEKHSQQLSKALKLVIAGWWLTEQRQMCWREIYKIRSSGQNPTAHPSHPDNHTQRREREGGRERRCGRDDWLIWARNSYIKTNVSYPMILIGMYHNARVMLC